MISSPRGTEMFHFPRFASATYFIQSRMQRYGPLRIAPFGNPRIEDCLRLPTDYRGLPRPSSPVAAKASVMRPNSLPANNSYWRPCMSRRAGPTAPRIRCSARPPRGERAALTRGASRAASLSNLSPSFCPYCQRAGAPRALGSAMLMRRRLADQSAGFL